MAPQEIQLLFSLEVLYLLCLCFCHHHRPLCLNCCKDWPCFLKLTVAKVNEFVPILVTSCLAGCESSL